MSGKIPQIAAPDTADAIFSAIFGIGREHQALAEKIVELEDKRPEALLTDTAEYRALEQAIENARLEIKQLNAIKARTHETSRFDR